MVAPNGRRLEWAWAYWRLRGPVVGIGPLGSRGNGWQEEGRGVPRPRGVVAPNGRRLEWAWACGGFGGCPPGGDWLSGSCPQRQGEYPWRWWGVFLGPVVWWPRMGVGWSGRGPVGGSGGVPPVGIGSLGAARSDKGRGSMARRPARAGPYVQ
ncbi:hypothetical protein GCM10027440_42360 [Nocardiopsis coralliicola]